MYLDILKKLINKQKQTISNFKYITILIFLFKFASCNSTTDTNPNPNLESIKISKRKKKDNPNKQKHLDFKKAKKNNHKKTEIPKSNKKEKNDNDNFKSVLKEEKNLRETESYNWKLSGKLKKRTQLSKYKYNPKLNNKKYNYKIELIEKNLYFKNLPKEFDGFRIGLLADVHIGYFKKWHFDKIYNAFYKNTKKGNYPVDIMLFLGDLVNYHLKEIKSKGKKWLKSFKDCAKYNLMPAILGNHDYDSYSFMLSKRPECRYEKKMEFFQNKTLGWKLLKNSHIILKKGKGKLKFIGIEHLGKCTIIKNRGDIKKSIDNLDCVYDISDGELKKISKKSINKKDKSFPIMLAHDPSIVKILWNKYKMPVVFSGHTHGASIMFDGIKDGSIKSLICKNPYPAGLYKSKSRKQFLYVSKGVGLSGVNLFGKEIILNDRNKKDRTPEVTIITLCRSIKKHN